MAATTREDPVGVALKHLDGAPASAEELRVLHARLARSPRVEGETVPPDRFPTELGSIGLPQREVVAQDLVLWALLALGEGHEKGCSERAEAAVRSVWGQALPSHATSDGLARLLSVPLLLLHPASLDEGAPVTDRGDTWKQMTDRCLAWFRGHLERAAGRDAAANWVLVRLPRVWLVPHRRDSTLGAEGDSRGGPTLSEQSDRWMPAEDGSLRSRPRRPSAKKAGGAR